MPAGNIGAVAAANRRARQRNGRSPAATGYPRPSTQLKIKIPPPAQHVPAEPPARIKDDQIVAYLEKFGYTASTLQLWKAMDTSSRPQLTLTMLGHTEIDDHTYYDVKCHLHITRGGTLEWHKQRRLTHFRDGIYDLVKEAFGEDYDGIFGDSRFARRGGLPGTTSRLQAWLQKLSRCINAETAPPLTVAAVLNFFEAPPPTFAIDRSSAAPSMTSSAAVVVDAPKEDTFNIDRDAESRDSAPSELPSRTVEEDVDDQSLEDVDFRGIENVEPNVVLDGNAESPSHSSYPVFKGS